ncbi:MAG: hypothetical protein EU531_05750 [Promethearchaeota archaeon]|nr:MAG: hypothetical protein EU531_05750 [Candidatus Lokiarchaeota archaeon]
MKFSIPRDNPDEMLLYIWKIVDLPYIYYDDLIYKVVFEYFIFMPDEVISFIGDALNKKLLVQDKNTLIRLSNDLNQKFLEWQKLRRIEIKTNSFSRKKRNATVKRIQNNNGNKFNQLLKRITDSAALNRAVSVSDDAVEILNVDKNEGFLDAKIKGTKEDSYIVNINVKEKTLIHNCHDFETRRAKSKKFCKHLIKLFLTLKRDDEELALYFLENIINQINDWVFSS